MAGESGQGHLSDDTAMDLGFLDELIGSGSGLLDDVNGFTDEVVSVDTFFDDYVTSLGAAAANQQQIAPQQGPAFDQLMEIGAPPIEVGPVVAADSTGSMTSPHESSAMPSIPRPAENVSSGRLENVQSHVGGGSSDEEGHHHNELERTKRNSKQQLQNKQAQQRYREKRKQRVQKLEGALGEISEQLKRKQDEASRLGKRNMFLEGKNQELSLALASKQVEIDALHAQITALQAACVNASRQRGRELGEVGHNLIQGNIVAENTLTTSATTPPEDPSRLRCQHNIIVDSMRQFCEAHGLRNLNPLGEGVDSAVLAQVRDLVGKACRSNQLLERTDVIQVSEAIRCSDLDLGRTTCINERSKWAALMTGLQLTSRQEQALLALRKQHLARLALLHLHRQRHNAKAMALMVAGRDTERNESVLSTRMACMSLTSYSRYAASSTQLYQELDLIKENLREEQKTVLEMKLVVFHRVLSPIQCLLLIIDAAPARPDALALANSVALKLGRATEDCPRAAQLLEMESASTAVKLENYVIGPPATQGNTCSGVGSCEQRRGSEGSSHQSDSCTACI